MTALKDALSKFVYIEAKVAQAKGLGRTRLTPPRCYEETTGVFTKESPKVRVTQPCSHAFGFHEPSGAGRSEMAGYLGLSYDKRTGALRFKAEPKHRFNGTLAPKTTERIAACAAVGLAYWSDHPKPNHVWAVDDEQQAHAVEIDVKASKARHACYSWTSASGAPCTHPTQGTSEPFEKPATMGDLMTMMQPPSRDVSAELGVTGHCSAGRHTRCPYQDGGQSHGGITTSDGNRYSCPCECHSVHQIETQIHQQPVADYTTPTPVPRVPTAQEVIAQVRGERARPAPSRPAPKTPKQVPAPDPLAEARVTVGSIGFDPDYLSEATDAELTAAYSVADQIEMEPDMESRIGAELDRRGIDLPE